jgi:hypothetical protein
MGQIHVLGALEGVVVDLPERRRIGAAACRWRNGLARFTGAEARERGGQQQGGAKHANLRVGEAGGTVIPSEARDLLGGRRKPAEKIPRFARDDGV